MSFDIVCPISIFYMKDLLQRWICGVRTKAHTWSESSSSLRHPKTFLCMLEIALFHSLRDVHTSIVSKIRQPHMSLTVIECLVRGEKISWPPRSLDLSSINFLLRLSLRSDVATTVTRKNTLPGATATVNQNTSVRTQ